MEEENSIVEEQAGFRAGRSTIDHIYTLLSVIQKSLAQKKSKVYIAFIDYLKAFDSVDRDKLWECMVKKGLSTKMLRILKSMYENVSCCVRCGIDYTDFFDSPAGVKQGCLMSPKIFCLFISEVAEELKKDEERGIRLDDMVTDIVSLLFADDVALVSHSVVGLQNPLNVLARASHRNGLKVNIDKTKVMIFRKGGHLSKNEKWFIDGQRLDVVNSYTYLGFTFTTRLSMSKGLEQTINRSKKKCISILRALWKLQCFDVNVFLKLFDLQVQPSLTYASEIWGLYNMKEIEKVHMYACRKVLRVSQKTPIAFIYG